MKKTKRRSTRNGQSNEFEELTDSTNQYNRGHSEAIASADCINVTAKQICSE
ncbi:Uncharacterized protein TCM_036505 [Theobroma cacao]|uniref:Uncharacterized protein n=1 Tax=Theobroma cacao TaxID=3641 RepID=A0A061FS40_THECC|nr:Uncharacterized protein TCM_036505 [Theobroma cacao]